MLIMLTTPVRTMPVRFLHILPNMPIYKVYIHVSGHEAS